MDLKELLKNMKPSRLVDLKKTTVGGIMDDMISGKIEADEAISTLAELSAKASAAITFILQVAKASEEADKAQSESSQKQG